MRRSDREIRDFDAILEVMKKCDVCRIAMQGDEYPYVIPLNFGMAVDGQQVVLYFHGAQTGMKYELLSKNNKVCFEMDCGHMLFTDIIAATAYLFLMFFSLALPGKAALAGMKADEMQSILVTPCLLYTSRCV